MTAFKATRWWRAVGPDGEVWAESSDEAEVRRLARPEDRIQNLKRLTIERWETA